MRGEMKTENYCETCWKFYDAVRDAENRRAFVAQQVRDVGSAHMIRMHLLADQTVTAAVAAFEAHKMNCAVHNGATV